MNQTSHGPLKPGVKLLSDENPWGLDPLELTLFVAQRIQGLSITEITQRYFLDRYNSKNRSFVLRLNRLNTLVLVQSRIPDRSSKRLLAIWEACSTPRVSTNQQEQLRRKAWEVLLSKPPLIRGEDLPMPVDGKTPLLVQVPANIRTSLPTPTDTVEKPVEITPVTEKKEPIVWPETCPRCRNRMSRPQDDGYGLHSTCWSCGYVHDPVVGPVIDPTMQTEPPPPDHHRARHGGHRI